LIPVLIAVSSLATWDLIKGALLRPADVVSFALVSTIGPPLALILSFIVFVALVAAIEHGTQSHGCGSCGKTTCGCLNKSWLATGLVLRLWAVLLTVVIPLADLLRSWWPLPASICGWVQLPSTFSLPFAIDINVAFPPACICVAPIPADVPFIFACLQTLGMLPILSLQAEPTIVVNG
jgi:hypothetical protein